MINVIFHPDFFKEFSTFEEIVSDEILAMIPLLKERGSNLGRPYVDTLKGSKFKNLKELRLRIDKGVWRIAFAFDPKRNAVLLIGGDKKGKNQLRFYDKLISTAEKRYTNYLEDLK